MAKFLCPYCFEFHTKEQCLIRCKYNKKFAPGEKPVRCAVGYQKDPQNFIMQDDGITEFNAKIKNILAKQKKCVKCSDINAAISYHCPTMRKEIPQTLLEVGSGLSIALIGARGSGKSNYIAVLVNELKRHLSSRFQCIVETNDLETKKAYDENYYQPLFGAKRVIPATATQEIPPLIYPIKFTKKNKIVDMATLTLYDSAGENFNSNDAMLIKNKYIPNSNGIILLVDPLQVPAIRKKIVEKGMPQSQLPAMATDIAEIVGTVAQTIRSIKKLKASQQIDIPVAVTFTKIDALEKYGLLDKNGALASESEHLERGVFVDIDFDNTNGEMRDLIENWLEGELESNLKNFKNFAFFGLTALGNIPMDDKIPEVNPKRVLDPLLWIFAQKKLIPRSKN